MSDEIIKVIDDLAEKFGIVIDWGSESILPYLTDLMNRIVRYEISTSIVWIVIGVIVCVLGIITSFQVHKWCEKYHDDDIYMFLIVTIPVVTIPAVLFGICMIVYQTHDIIRCMYIPEAVAYDVFRNMFTNHL